ncbi:hypothetical protein PINS_up006062 [Pythium insidiosum]|nr:hypothetical protein PINS_up006062 [Pythium insidiosum]
MNYYSPHCYVESNSSLRFVELEDGSLVIFGAVSMVRLDPSVQSLIRNVSELVVLNNSTLIRKDMMVNDETTVACSSCGLMTRENYVWYSSGEREHVERHAMMSPTDTIKSRE